MLEVVGKLRGRRPAELRVRGVQALSAHLERLHFSPQVRQLSDAALFRRLDPLYFGRPPATIEQVLDHFRRRESARFFAGFADRAETVRALRLQWPEDERTVTEKADEILRGRFDLFGWHGVKCNPQCPDWHWDPSSNRHAPRRHWSTIRYLDVDSVGDSKVIWELNRHQYFSILGRAYWYSRDERYAQTFVQHVTSWMCANPPKIGINWASSLEVAFRAISWLWALYFFRESPQLTPRVFLNMLKYLYVHARHLERYLSTYFSPNTHLTGEALGLVYLGTVLTEFDRARQWRETGWAILLDQLARQVRPDGVYFEQATQYHRYTTDFYIHAAILGALNELPGRDAIDPTLRALLDHLMYMTRPDGTTPLIGDDDGGQLIPLDDGTANDARSTLATGAVLFTRPDYAYVAGQLSQQALWLLGPSSERKFRDLRPTPPEEASRAFREGGFFVMRDGWHREANVAVIDCGPHGALTCGHAHADALSIELVALGRPFLVDAGTYTYTGSLEARNYFRGTAAHNTVVVDGEPSSVPSSAFKWSHIAQSRCTGWISDVRFDYFDGLHDGYERLPMPAIHRRSVLFIKGSYWVIRDRIESTGDHRLSVHFHCSPDVRAEADNGGFVLRGTSALDTTALRICGFGRGLAFVRADGCISPGYGTRVPATECILTTEGTGNQEVLSFLLPYPDGIAAPQVAEIDAIRGRAFRVIATDARDTLLIGGPDGAEAGGVATDAAWAIVRRSQHGEPVEFILIGGRFLEADGVTLFGVDRVAQHATGRCVDSRWHVANDQAGANSGRQSEPSEPCAASAE